MKNFYFTLGQDHRHQIGDKYLDKDSVVRIKAEDHGLARDKMFDLCGPKWCFQYDELPDMSYFPRGVIDL